MEIRTKTIERLRDALLQSGRRNSAVTSSAYRTVAREGFFTDEEKTALTRVEAVAETMFLVIAADEQVMDTEMDALRGAIRGLTGEVLSDGIVQVMVESFALRLRNDGKEKRLAAIADAFSDSAEAQNALALAAAVAWADGQVASTESNVIVELQKAFSLSDEDVRTVLGQVAEDQG
jgi:tellurite resistance protein